MLALGGGCGTLSEMHAPAAIARHALRMIVDFALPPRCPGCGAIVQEEHSFCLDCWSELVFLGAPCCARCGLPFEHDGGGAEAECGACLAHPPRFDRARAAVAYGDIPRKVALKLKYGGRPGVAETMARLMERHLEPGSDAVLAPVPLHRWRIWERGYNQAGLIASVLARRSGTALLDALERRKATPYLRGMGPRERALAVRGAFEVPERRRAAIAGRRVVLVDDVFTSGATANACAMALKKAGAAEVQLLCWARVVKGGDN